MAKKKPAQQDAGSHPVEPKVQEGPVRILVKSNLEYPFQLLTGETLPAKGELEVNDWETNETNGLIQQLVEQNILEVFEERDG